VVNQLYAAGVEEVVIGGSFTTAAPFPNDIDGFWVYPQQFDPSKVDDDILMMERFELHPVSGEWVRLVKLKYGVELFMEHPALVKAGKSFRDFFACSRDGHPRGCIRIVKEAQA
jgi:hypothetical protein